MEAFVTMRIPTVNSRRPRGIAPSIGVLLGLALASAHCADQPRVRCGATSGQVIARYESTGAPTGTCTGVTLPGKGEALGLQTFVPSPADANAHDEVSSLAIKAGWIGARIADARDSAANTAQNPSLASMADALTNYPYGTGTPPAPPPDGPPSTSFPYAFGPFDAVYPDANDVCKVSKIAPSELTYPDIPAHLVPDPAADPNAPAATPWIPADDQPETAVKYAWSNVRVIVSAESIGTQTFADLTLTRDGCSASYHASILSPRVGCGGTDAAGKAIADATLCDPGPTPVNPYGSGIGQGIPTSCENIGDDANPDFECVPTRMAP